MSKTTKTSTKTPKLTKQVSQFNLLERSSVFRHAVRETMAKLTDRVRTGATLTYDALPSNRTRMIPLNDVTLMWLLNSFGLIGGRIVDLIGADGIGKSTFLTFLLGLGVRHNSPGLLVETESKPMDKARALRCLHPNPELAERMWDTICWEQAYELKTAIDLVESWAIATRTPGTPGYVPIDIPIIGAIDTFSKLMAPLEAVKRDYYGADAPKSAEEKKAAEEKEKKEAAKKGKKKKTAAEMEMDSANNMGHAKIAQRWCRTLPGFLTRHNMLLILVRHQNDKVEMSGGGGGVMLSQDVKDQINRTSIGGRAFNQSAAWQLVGTRAERDTATINGAQRAVGQYNILNMAKNSYGPSGRKIRYRIMMEPRQDTDNWLEPAIDFSPSIGEVLKATGMFTVTFTDKGNGISVKELGLTAATPQQVVEALRSPQYADLVDAAGAKLNWAGKNFGNAPMNPVFLEAA